MQKKMTRGKYQNVSKEVKEKKATIWMQTILKYPWRWKTKASWLKEKVYKIWKNKNTLDIDCL